MTPEKRRELYGLLNDAVPMLAFASARWPDDSKGDDAWACGRVRAAEHIVQTVLKHFEEEMDNAST